MAMDRFEARVEPVAYDFIWPEAEEYRRVELRVNGIGLIDMVREVELPFAVREYNDRVAAGESAADLGPRDGLAGNYIYPTVASTFHPSRQLLGETYKHGFLTEVNDPRSGKSLLLGCTCGIIDCWFLLAKITVDEATVTWSDFIQFHRDWTYDLGPFVFDRREYEAQLVGA